jgi:hypothetical protein
VGVKSGGVKGESEVKGEGRRSEGRVAGSEGRE